MGVVGDVQAYLEEQSLVGGGTGVTSYRHKMADTPDHQLVITSDGGGRPEIPSVSGIGDQAWENDGVQLLCRSDPNDGDQAEALLDSIYDTLHGLKGVTMGSQFYVSVRARTAAPVPLGFDVKGRAMFSQSYLLKRFV